MITKTSKNRIALDIGNVLCHLDFKPMVTELLLQNLCADEQSATQFFKDLQTFHDLGIVDMDLALRTRFNISKKQVDALKEAWLAIVIPSKPMFELLTELIAEKAQVALLSNIGFDHANYLCSICPQFNYCIKHFSCFVGARKPTKLFFQSFIQDYPEFNQNKFDWQPTEVARKYYIPTGLPSRGLFFDDLMDNVDAAHFYLDSHYFNLNDFSDDQDAVKKMIQIIQE